ncbi:hypothetical protein OQA88_8696 [Cercophora sp. LCS_1]
MDKLPTELIELVTGVFDDEDDFLSFRLVSIILFAITSARFTYGNAGKTPGSLPSYVLGTGHDNPWVRDPSTDLIVTSPGTSPVIDQLRDTLPRFGGLRSLVIDADGLGVPHPLKSGGLCVEDVVHVLLVAIAGVPLRSFTVTNAGAGLVRDLGKHLLPSNIIKALTPCWSKALVDLDLSWGHFFARSGSDSPMESVILRATSLRRLRMALIPRELYGPLISLEDFPPLEVLELGPCSTGLFADVRDLVLKAAPTLRHLSISFTALIGKISEWQSMLREWAMHLKKLTSFVSFHIQLTGHHFNGEEWERVTRCLQLDSMLEKWDKAPTR